MRCQGGGLQPPARCASILPPRGRDSWGTSAPSARLEGIHRPRLAPPAGSLTQLPPLALEGEELLPQRLHVQVQPAESFTCQGGDIKGLTGAEGSFVWGRGPPPCPEPPPSCAEHPPEEILRNTVASSSIVQLNCSSRSSRSWGWVRNSLAAGGGGRQWPPPWQGWVTRQPWGQHPPGWDSNTLPGVSPAASP